MDNGTRVRIAVLPADDNGDYADGTGTVTSQTSSPQMVCVEMDNMPGKWLVFFISELCDLSGERMEIQEAIEILNKNRHLGFDSWRSRRDDDETIAPDGETDWRYCQKTPFETIAIAEKYQRELL